MENQEILRAYNENPIAFAKRIKFKLSKGLKFFLIFFGVFVIFSTSMMLVTSKGSHSVFTKKIETNAEVFNIRETITTSKYAIYKFIDNSGHEHIDSIYQFDDGYKVNNKIGDKLEVIYDSKNPSDYHLKNEGISLLSFFIPLILMSFWLFIPLCIAFIFFATAKNKLKSGNAIIGKILFIKENSDLSIFSNYTIIIKDNNDKEYNIICRAKWLVNGFKIGDEVVAVVNGKSGVLPFEYMYR